MSSRVSPSSAAALLALHRWLNHHRHGCLCRCPGHSPSSLGPLPTAIDDLQPLLRWPFTVRLHLLHVDAANPRPLEFPGCLGRLQPRSLIRHHGHSSPGVSVVLHSPWILIVTVARSFTWEADRRTARLHVCQEVRLNLTFVLECWRNCVRFCLLRIVECRGGVQGFSDVHRFQDAVPSSRKHNQSLILVESCWNCAINQFSCWLERMSKLHLCRTFRVPELHNKKIPGHDFWLRNVNPDLVCRHNRPETFSLSFWQLLYILFLLEWTVYVS